MASKNKQTLDRSLDELSEVYSMNIKDEVYDFFG